MTTCAHCLGPQGGSAQVNDSPLCHPADGLDCYRLVTVYGHAMPCTECVLARQSDDAADDYDDDLLALAAYRVANDSGRRYTVEEVLDLLDQA